MQLNKDEKIKDVEGYEGLYAVTSLGRIWSYRRKKFIKTWPDAYGYLRVIFSIKNQQSIHKLHRLVGKAFIENPDNKPQINHKNGKKMDCEAKNLEWVTARENMQHAYDIGLNSCFKLSYDDKKLICKMYLKGNVKQTTIASMFEVTPPAINYIIYTYTPIFLANQN